MSELKKMVKGLNLAKMALLPGEVDNRDPRLVEIFEQWWPECYESDFSGKVVMSPEDAANLEELFELFGLDIKVADNNINALVRVYDIVAMYGLGSQLDNFMTLSDEQLRRRYDNWPDAWVRYMTAVARADKSTARKLAKELQVLAPDCEYPYGVFIKKVSLPAP